MSLRVRARCKTGFPDYKYFCKKFTRTVSCLAKLTSDTKLKNESLAELEDLSQYFTKNELEIVVYMNDETDWKSIRAQFVSLPGEEKNRVSLREETQEWATPHKESKVTWELLEKDLIESIKRKTFLCVLASSNQKKLEQIARDIYGSTRPEINENQENGILFYNTHSDKNLSLSEMIKCDFGLTSEKIPSSPEMDSLYDRVKSLLKARIETLLRFMLTFVQSYLPQTEKGLFVDLYDLGKPEVEPHVEEKQGLYDLDKSGVERVEEKQGLWKIMYEIFSWIRCMKLNIGEVVPEIPKLPMELQRELLRLEGVEGCGTIWGKLTLHVAAEKMSEISRLVPGILQKHAYTSGYRVHEFVKREAQAGGQIKPGSKMSVKLTEEGKRKLNETAQDKKDASNVEDGDKLSCGTVGCFVADQLADIYGITCAHCLKYCEGNIEVANVKISSIPDVIQCYQGDAIDIAAMKVVERMKDSCVAKLCCEDGGNIDDGWSDGQREWCFYEGEAGDPCLELSVFKKGSETDITHGIVMCNEYRTAQMEQLADARRSFNDMFNILIEPKPGSDEVFSKGGDSGSAVCAEFPDGSLKVISILQGSISTKDKDGNIIYHYSISSHMKKSLDILGQAAQFDVPNF